MNWVSRLISGTINYILFKVSGYLKCKIIIGNDGEPYLERYFIARWGKKRKAIFLHRFLNSDTNPGVHDHPWDCKSFVLTGGYSERRLVKYEGKEKLVWRVIKPLTLHNIKKNDFHQIILKNKKPVWTLFYHGAKSKGWGFQHYKFLPDASIQKEDFFPMQNTKEINWEDKALKGKKSNRACLRYVMKKNH